METPILLPQPVTTPISIFLHPSPDFNFESSQTCAPNEFGYVKWNDFSPPDPSKDNQSYRKLGCLNSNKRILHAFCSAVFPAYKQNEGVEKAEEFVRKITLQAQANISQATFTELSYPSILRKSISQKECETFCWWLTHFKVTVYLVFESFSSLKKKIKRIGPVDQKSFILIVPPCSSDSQINNAQLIVRIDEYRLGDGSLRRKYVTTFDADEPLICWLNSP